MPLHWKIHECAAYHERLHLCGWCFQAAPRAVKIEMVFPKPATAVPLRSYGLPSPDVQFDDWLPFPNTRRFVAAFFFSVFEHLAMPWNVALELNRVLEPGGLVFTATHPTYPMHEEPWDFWRFSPPSWQTLFNAATGFEIVEAVCGEPARVHACRTNPVTRDIPGSAKAYLGSASIARKISDTALAWPVPVGTAARDSYPAGELAQPRVSATVAFQRA
ncbi:MAG: methyltransferase domain-containing protein [Opitutaceae bacterium]